MTEQELGDKSEPVYGPKVLLVLSLKERKIGRKRGRERAGWDGKGKKLLAQLFKIYKPSHNQLCGPI